MLGLEDLGDRAASADAGQDGGECRLAEFPPTLVMTAELDTRRHDINDLVADMASKVVNVTHREFPASTAVSPTQALRRPPASPCN